MLNTNKSLRVQWCYPNHVKTKQTYITHTKKYVLIQQYIILIIEIRA